MEGPAHAPIVIAHRGASGYRPEHTLAAYRLAIEMGADGVEPDLVATRDGVLVVRHENELSGTTDVAEHPELAGRRSTRVVDGREVTGWFTEDLTVAELRTLRATERLPRLRPTNTAYDGQLPIVTLDELLDLVVVERRRRGRRISVHPELKHVSHFAARGLRLETLLLRTLCRHGLDRPDAGVFIQSFEVGPLRRLRRMTQVPLVQLVDAGGAPVDLARSGHPHRYADLLTPAGLADVASYADGISVHKDLVLPRAADGSTGLPTSLVTDAHDRGLLVHAWTLRSENHFLPAQLRVGTDPAAPGDAGAEHQALLDAGVDGLFTDQPDTGVAARDAWLSLQPVG